MVTKRRNYTKRRKPKTNRRNTRRHTKRRNVKKKNTKKRNNFKKSNKILIQEGGMLDCSRRLSNKESKANRRIQVRERERDPMLSSADDTAAGARKHGARSRMTGATREDLDNIARDLGINPTYYPDDRKLELILKILREDYHFSERDPVPKRSPPSPSLSEAPTSSVKKDPILDYADGIADMIIEFPHISEENIRAFAKSKFRADRVDYPFELKSELYDLYLKERRKEEAKKELSRVPFYQKAESRKQKAEPSVDLKAFMRDQKAEEASKERMRLQASRRAWIEGNRERGGASAGANKRGYTSPGSGNR